MRPWRAARLIRSSWRGCWPAPGRPAGRWCSRWMRRPGPGWRRDVPGRGLHYHPSRQTRGKPVVPGWCFQLISRLNFDRDSWTWPMSCQRVDPGQDAARVTIGQVRAVAAGLDGAGPVPWFVFDAGSCYDPAALTAGLAGDRVALLIRLRKNRVFFADPPPRAREATGLPACTGRDSTSKTKPPGAPQPPSSRSATRSMGRCGSRPGRACTRGLPAMAAGPVPHRRPSCGAGSSGCR